MKSHHYLVTGGTGFIGGALVRRLVEEGHTVRVFDNDSRGSIDRLSDIKNQVEFISGDIRDADAVMKAVVGVDGVFHLAFVNGTRFFYTEPELVLEVGVKGMVNVLDACVRHGVKELILASSSEVYQTPPQVPTDESVPLSIPNPLNPRYSYAAGKIISEMMTINYGRSHFDRVLIFRPHNVYGPQMGWEHVIPEFLVRILTAIRSESAQAGTIPFEIQGSGDESRSFIFIDDFVDGVMTMLKSGEHLGIYHIGTREEVSIKELAHLVAKTLNQKIKMIPGKISEGSTLRRCPDISKLAALGFQPKYNLEKALPIVAQWYRENLELAPISKEK